MQTKETPIVCDLSKLTPEERARERDLLAAFRQMIGGSVETEHGYQYSVPADPGTLAMIGELLGLERLCCPFLSFQLEVSAQDTASVLIHGGSGVKAVIAAEFGS
jgi:hypothetical protein